MKNSTHKRTLLIGSLAALVIVGAFTGPAFAQSPAYPQTSNCLSPRDATQRQECNTQRQPFYTSDDHIARQPNARLEMNLDNGGGGTQTPVVPNTTGAPVTSGGADGIGPPVD